MNRSRARGLKLVVGASLAGVVALAVASPSSDAAGVTPRPAPYVALHGAGAWSVAAQLVGWQNELATATSPIDLNYVRHGSFLARGDLLKQQVDFAISGVPFSADELAQSGGASAFIDAPVEVASASAFVEPPRGGFHTVAILCDPDDPTTWPNYPADPPPVFAPDVDCVVKTSYSGPVRIPNRNLSAMFLHYVGTSLLPLYAWNNPDVLHAFGVDRIETFAPPAGPGVAGRSDPDEINYYMQAFIKTAVPDVWLGNQKVNPQVPWEPITERISQVAGVTRDGPEQQLAQLVHDGCGVLGDCGAQSIAGGIAPAPPSLLREFKSEFPRQPIALAEIQNASGDWVAPNSDSINRAVDAGGDAPLYALSNKVAGAYPLVWIDHLYAPAHGLSISKTEALAMLIRYLVTTGQETAAGVGEGRLAPALVARSLAAANQLVVSNCVGAGRRIVDSRDPGPLAPATAAAMKSIGNMLHCEPAPPATTSTTTTTTSTLPTVTTTPPSSFGSTGDTLPMMTTVPTSIDRSTVMRSNDGTPAAGSSDTIRTGAGGSRPSRVGLLTASDLPLPVPTSTSGVDRLATFLLGVAIYLLARKPIMAGAKRMRS